ncbi:MAG: hypothetical protein HYR63_22975 [Proteobacteria bacterium]|nr:hypothetical protein [Pseudomonadota bacterium]
MTLASKSKFLAIAALAAQMAASVAWIEPASAEDLHVGVTTCAGSTCHGAVQPLKNSGVAQNEYITWQRKDRHAKAYEMLLGERSKRIAANLGLKDAHTSEICLDCHADNVPNELRGRQFQISDGVGCEACHGGSQRWLGPHVAAVASIAELHKIGLYPTEDPVARAKLCLACHFGDDKRFVTHRIMGAGHPRMSFELNTFTQIQPAHYVLDDNYRKRKVAASGVQTWAIGQALALSTVMGQLQEAKRQKPGPFPELVFYDCYACHHPLSNVRWESRASTGLGPGVVRFNDANALMLRVIAQRLAPEIATGLNDQVLALHQAMAEGKGDVSESARRVKANADALTQRFAAHSFDREDIRALMRGLVGAGLANDFSDYAGAEQATMALASLTQSLRSANDLNEQQFNALKAALDQCYAATASQDAYRSEEFIKALRSFQQAMAPS